MFIAASATTIEENPMDSEVIIIFLTPFTILSFCPAQLHSLSPSISFTSFQSTEPLDQYTSCIPLYS